VRCRGFTQWRRPVCSPCEREGPVSNGRVHVRDGSFAFGGGQTGRCVAAWPLQEIGLLRGCCARITHPFTTSVYLHCPPWCNTIARLLSSIRLPLRAPVCMLYNKHDWQHQYRVKAKLQRAASRPSSRS